MGRSPRFPAHLDDTGEQAANAHLCGTRKQRESDIRGTWPSLLRRINSAVVRSTPSK